MQGRSADLWVEAKRGFSELLSNKRGFGSKGNKGYACNSSKHTGRERERERERGSTTINMTNDESLCFSLSFLVHFFVSQSPCLLVVATSTDFEQSAKTRLEPGIVSPRLSVPATIRKPPYAETQENPPWDNDYQIQDKLGIEKMRASCKFAAEVLDMAGKMVKPGITTDSIDRAVHQMVIDRGAYPSPLGYGGFPKSVCTSINECICHGIPDSRELQDGDIVNIDVTVFLDGFHGDTSRMFLVGESVSPEAKRLVDATKESLDASIAICGPGVPFNQIGHTIQKVANSYKMNVVKSFVGHGVGSVFHSSPAILHYPNREPGKMHVGQTFTIEPMLTLGSIKPVFWKDDWTAVTADGSLSAQYEHSLLITQDGVEILTKYEEE